MKKNYQKISSWILRTMMELLIVITLSLCITAFIGQPAKIAGSSMENTFHDKELLLINKLSYRFSDPKRFDVVVFFPEKDNYFIKRIIGLPGENVRIDKNGVIYINEKKLEENYGKEPILNAGYATDGITLKENEYFVMGDNRNNSSDSRFKRVGPVDKSKIIGKIAFH